MNIFFERSGGFAGLTLSNTIHVDELPETDAEKLKVLIDESGFASLPEKIESERNAPDQFTYTIKVESREWTHTVITGDASAPNEILPLLDALNEISRTHRKNPG